MGLDIVYDQQPVIWLAYRVLSVSGFSAGLVLGMLLGRGGLYATELQNIYPREKEKVCMDDEKLLKYK